MLCPVGVAVRYHCTTLCAVWQWAVFGGVQMMADVLCKALELGVMAFMVTVRDAREEAEIMKYVGVHDVQLGKGRVRKSFAT